ncbi:hypothetical protein [Limimaricola pyoseonensis]|uniref:Uncharacterized protein n=1 Tax=Limimaricola pyoseonensis TaxID=521013 RepID=A0A1G7GT31_9RHOB|nr:hypothetical protein [Limimaricola pyoseonensis]SDE91119.1 hypothetical protein SAMN04488567_2907 [Limimaricola pyoseonensis]
MTVRSSESVVTFTHPFRISGYSEELPEGDYMVVVEEELLQGLSFEAYRRTGTYLTVQGRGNRADSSETRPVTQKALEAALDRDRMLAAENDNSSA